MITVPKPTKYIRNCFEAITTSYVLNEKYPLKDDGKIIIIIMYSSDLQFLLVTTMLWEFSLAKCYVYLDETIGLNKVNVNTAFWNCTNKFNECLKKEMALPYETVVDEQCK